MSMSGVTVRGSYSARILHRWAATIASWLGEQRNVFVYFDNDQKGAAPENARRLTAVLQASASGIRSH
jgi:uncharacterized protein YecE (DUF72 family)